MRIIICLLCMMLPYINRAQDQREKNSNQQYYLQEARYNISAARQYADSMVVITLLDSIDLYVQKVLELVERHLANQMEDVPETTVDTADFYAEGYDQQVEVMDEPDEADESIEVNNDIFKKISPFRKMKTKFVIETGINNYFMNLTNTSVLEGKVSPGTSWFWNFGFQRQIHLGKKVKIETGISLLRNRFRFSNDVRLVAEGSGETPAFTKVNNASNDPKLILSYLTLPLSFEFKISKSLHVNAGAYAGYLVGSTQKVAIKENEEEIYQVRSGAYALNKWMYGIRGGVGLGGLDIFVNYNLTNLFENRKSFDYSIYMIGTSWKI
ncbi:MAG: outer membrane beta-barrel protein [Saprospiraceae bacterium]|nr:outer membrane beta-barrel protein [Saprospiraceae bacterium]